MAGRCQMQVPKAQDEFSPRHSHAFESRPTPTRLAKALITISGGIWNLLERLPHRIDRTLTEAESEAELQKFQGRALPWEVGVSR